ncbi:MAG: hypothetical protein PVS2B2_26720 [Candidatus Acidiferrum sp.]
MWFSKEDRERQIRIENNLVNSNSAAHAKLDLLRSDMATDYTDRNDFLNNKFNDIHEKLDKISAHISEISISDRSFIRQEIKNEADRVISSIAKRKRAGK